ncbi:MAG TPA: hypothetical protein VEV17_27130 [Bryobacteraceae bacterium]|nr:hypothetical protein [Bryobacteraceae bacterium]
MSLKLEAPSSGAVTDTLPHLHAWSEIEIAFTSANRIQIRVGIQTESRNFEEMGFLNKKSGLPVLAWTALRNLAEARGVIHTTDYSHEWSRLEKWGIRGKMNAIPG